jgi:DNA-binding transcriptional LysR family regulator
MLGFRGALGEEAIFDPATARRTFTAMVPDFVVPRLVPRLLGRVLMEAPSVRFQFENWSAAGAERLTRGEIDFCIALDHAQPLRCSVMTDSLSSVELERVNWVCAVASDHPTIRTEVTREQFPQLPHIYVRTPGESIPVEQVVWRQLRLELEVPFMLPVPLLAMIPEVLAAALRSSLSIRVLPLPSSLSFRSRLRLYWHRRAEPDPAHAWARRRVIEVSREPADATNAANPAQRSASPDIGGGN